MGNENGVWIMHGMDETNARRVQSAEQLIDRIDEIGFLPLFKNEVDGFSVEEQTSAEFWWSGDELRDPWEWRAILARSGRVAYGKFFNKKAGFVSKEWTPIFANYRRDGYDFDALCDDGKAEFRQKKIMSFFDGGAEIYSNELKARAGFGKGAMRNFEGVVTALQMSMFLCVRDFRCRVSKKDEPYGWPIAVYSTPEQLWGGAHIAQGYAEEPSASLERILAHIKKQYPSAKESQIMKVVKR